MHPPELASAPPPESVSPAEEPEGADPIDNEGACSSGHRSVKRVLDEAIQSFHGTEVMTLDRMSHDNCLLRLRALVPPMKAFVQEARRCEGFLSPACLGLDVGKAVLVPGTQQYTANLIAEANYKHCISSIRISRHASWAFHMDKVGEYAKAISPSIPGFGTPKKFRSSAIKDEQGQRSYQVVGYRKGNDVFLGVVLEIFRGALLKAPKKKGKKFSKKLEARMMRATKPHAWELDCKQCARVKVASLSRSEFSDVYSTSCLHPGLLLDPLSIEAGVVCEFHVAEIVESFPRLTLRLGPDASDRIAAIKKVGITCYPPHPPLPPTPHLTPSHILPHINKKNGPLDNFPQNQIQPP